MTPIDSVALLAYIAEHPEHLLLGLVLVVVMLVAAGAICSMFVREEDK